MSFSSLGHIQEQNLSPLKEIIRGIGDISSQSLHNLNISHRSYSHSRYSSGTYMVRDVVVSSCYICLNNFSPPWFLALPAPHAANVNERDGH